MSSIDNPIFVRGMSRSGGTLMVTVLDAHPDVAMSYELYPNLLDVEAPLDLRQLAGVLEKNSSRQLTKAVPQKSIFTFVARCERGGLTYPDVAKLVHQLADEGRDFSTIEGRLRLVELCGLEKMKRLGKSRWGMKCTGVFEAYRSYWKQPYFLNMLRDGRDVLASQLNTGSFKKSPAEVARAWVNTHTKFTDLVNNPDAHAYMVSYETLTADPEPELRKICAFLGLPFDEAILRHTEQDLTVFKASHLSGARINKSIDTSRIGRWKKDLSRAQIDEFMSAAGDALTQFGYE